MHKQENPVQIRTRALWSEAKRIDWVLLLAVAALCLFGLMMVHSTTVGTRYTTDEDPLFFFRNQARAVFIGVILMIILSSMRLEWLQSLALPSILLSILTLTFLLVFNEPVFGAARFLFAGRYQVATFARVSVLLYVSVWIASRGRRQARSSLQGLISFSLIVGLVASLILLQPDITSSVLLMLAAFSLYFVAGATWQYFALYGFAGVVAFALLLFSLPYAQSRVVDWMAVVNQPTRGSYHIQTILAAISNGGVWGQGYRLGQVKYIIPVPFSDSVYATVCEEFGLIGSLLISALLLLIAWRGIKIARKSDNYFGYLLAYGVSVLLLWQVLTNVGVMTAVFPAAGLPLPYISYGGSDLVVQFVVVGLLLSVSRHGDAAVESDTPPDKERKRARRLMFSWSTLLICASVLLLGLLVYRNTQLISGVPTQNIEDAFDIVASATSTLSFTVNRLVVFGFFAVFLYSLFDMRLTAVRFDQDWVAIIEENLEKTGRVEAALLGRNGAELLATYLRQHPERDLTLPNKTLLQYANNDLRQKNQAVWRLVNSMNENEGGVSGGMAAMVLEVLSEMLASPIEAFEGTLSGTSFHVFLLNTYDLFSSLRLPRQLLILMPAKSQLTENEWMSIPELTRQISGKVDIAILLAWSARHRSAMSLTRLREVLAFDVVVIGQPEMLTLSTRRHRRDHFRRLILSVINLHTISPFVTAGATPETMFVGREKEIREIVEHATTTNYVVVGGRRIGKTSLLRRLHGIRLPAAGVLALYQDCTIISSYAGFLATPLRDWRPAPPAQAPATFGDLLKMPALDQPLMLLLDEADKIVNLDRQQGWPILEAMRALTNSSNVKVVLCGERVLLGALQDSSGPLFNLVDPVRLGPLDYPSVADLIVRPMSQLGIRLVPEDEVVERIWDITSGHPNLVQRLCSRLLDRLLRENPDREIVQQIISDSPPGKEVHDGGFQWREIAGRAVSFLLPESLNLAETGGASEANRLETSLARTITLADVEAVAQEPGFLRDDLLETYWGSATTLEKIVSLLMAENPHLRTLSTIKEALVARCNLDVSSREIDASLQLLVDLRLILNRTPSGYQFRATAFPSVVAQTLTLEDTLAVQVEEYREQQ